MMMMMIIVIYPLSARVALAPQMISQPASSVFHVLYCPLELGELQACPFPDVVFPSFPFYVTLIKKIKVIVSVRHGITPFLFVCRSVVGGF